MTIEREHIEKRAYYLSQQEKSYDQWIWRLAEITLLLESSVRPKPEQIRPIADTIGKQKPELHELHWLIAEKELLYREKYKKNPCCF